MADWAGAAGIMNAQVESKQKQTTSALQNWTRDKRLAEILDVYRTERAAGLFKTEQEYMALCAVLSKLDGGLELIQVCWYLQRHVVRASMYAANMVEIV